MTEEERNRYLEAYYDNEADANRQMSFANAMAAGLIFIIWMFYVTGFFKIVNATLPLINTIFPITILILLSPVVYALWFKKHLRKKNYKFFVIFSFIAVVAALIADNENEINYDLLTNPSSYNEII